MDKLMIQLKAQLTFAFTLILYDYSDFFFVVFQLVKMAEW